MEAVGEYGGLALDLTRELGEAGSYTEFQDGDVVVAKITPCFENGKGALAEGLFNGAALGTTELHVLRPAAALDRRFLFYLTISDAFRKAGESEMYGAGGQKRVPTEFIRNVATPIPPAEEQRAIARFLDGQTAKIDSLIERKRELIERLREKRTAVISRTVTRGLPPEAARAAGFDPRPRLKDGGIDWLGEIPTNWDVLPFTKFAAEQSDYRGRTPEKVPDGVILVTARNIKMGFIDYECSEEFIAPEDYGKVMSRGLPRNDDILFTTEAPLGNVALVDRQDIALAQRVIRFRMVPQRLDQRFTLYAMMARYFQSQLASLSTGSTAEGLKASKLHILRIVAPSLMEQRAIAHYLTEETARIGRTIVSVDVAIERLKEYRSALITAAVTGKIDVRQAVA